MGCSPSPPSLSSNASGAGGATAQASAPGSQSSVVSSSATGLTLPAEFTVTGTVVDEDNAPVRDAIVLQGGRSHEPLLLTDSDGTFSLKVRYPGYGKPGLAASKRGYQTASHEFYEVPPAPLRLVLQRIPKEDNPSYEFGEPGTGDGDPSTLYCGHCHESFAADFHQSKHRQSASNPRVLDIYGGTVSNVKDKAGCDALGGNWDIGLTPGKPSEASPRCYLGEGVVPDLNAQCGGSNQPRCDNPNISANEAPSAFGACASCHAPAVVDANANADLHQASGVAFDSGVSCDVCHKVSSIDLSRPAGIGPQQRLKLLRPGSSSNLNMPDPLMFGPLVDVTNGFMGASYQPQFKEALFCAGCHQYEQPALLPGQTVDAARWPKGLPIHSTYEEWLNGPYSQSNTPCQHCHMPADYDLINTTDTATKENASITFGYPRPPSDIRKHIFRSPLQQTDDGQRLIDQALYTQLNLERQNDTLNITTTLNNVGCGHAVPTGEPLRALILLLRVSGTNCANLRQIAGETVFDVGGYRAKGTLGQGLSLQGLNLQWPAGAQVAAANQVVRVVRPTQDFKDYVGIGRFADPGLSPQDKGLPAHVPVGTAVVNSAQGDTIILSNPITATAGDIVYLGDRVLAGIKTQPAKPYAGAAGFAFARVLVDAAGNRHVPHYRAVDMVSDNRIAPGKNQSTFHSYDVAGCTSVEVHADVLYRPLPLSEAKRRQWLSEDHLISSATSSLSFP